MRPPKASREVTPIHRASALWGSVPAVFHVTSRGRAAAAYPRRHLPLTVFLGPAVVGCLGELPGSLLLGEGVRWRTQRGGRGMPCLCLFMTCLGVGAVSQSSRLLGRAGCRGVRIAGTSLTGSCQEEEEPCAFPWGTCPAAAWGVLPALDPPPCEPNTGPGTEAVKKESMAPEG